MKLSELNPRWIHPDIFAFDCPCCRKAILTCKRVQMGVCDQFEVMVKFFGEDNGLTIVPCANEQCWKLDSDDFSAMTVTPSIDASQSGHWHGFIKNGEIQ